MRKTGSFFSLLFIAFTLNAYSQSPENLFQAGRKAFEDRLFLIAGKNFKQLADLFPDDPLADDSEYLEAVSYFYLKEYRKVYLTLKSFNQKYPFSPHIRLINYWKGIAHYYLGEYEESIRCFYTQTERYTVADNYLSHSFLLLGMALEKTGRLHEARKPYKRLINQKTSKPLLSVALFRLGGIELQLKNFHSALKAFTKVLVDHPDSEQAKDALFFTAECYFYLDKSYEAEDRYRQVLSQPLGGNHRETICFRLIQILSGRGEASEALAWVEKFEQDFPYSSYGKELFHIKADVLFDLKQYGHALKEYQKALKAAATLEELQVICYNMGLASLLHGEKEEALKTFRNALTGDPEIIEKSLFRLGTTLVELHRDDEAIDVLEDFRVRFPSSDQNEEVLRLLGSLYERSDLFIEAKGVFTQLLTHYPDSKDLDEYLFKRGSAVLSLGDTAGALRDYFRIIKAFPDSNYTCECQYNIGYIYSLRKEYTRAIPFFKAVLERELPGDLHERATLAIGVCYFNNGKYDSARLHFEEITLRDTSSPWAGEGWFYLGRTFYKMEHLKDSANSFRQAALAFGPGQNGAEALYWQGLAEFRLRAYSRAREAFLSLSRQYPSSNRVAEAYYRAGLCESQLENFPESIEYFDLALREMIRQPEKDLNEEVLFQKGWNLYKMGKRGAALSVFKTLAENYPGSLLVPEAFYTLAEADFRDGEFKEALKGFTKVITEYPDAEVSRAAYYWAGASSSRIGEVKLALKYYWQYLERSPEGSLVDLASSEIQNILSSSRDFNAIREFYYSIEKNPETPVQLKNQVRYEYACLIFKDGSSQPLREALAIFERIRDSGVSEPLKSKVNYMIGEYYLLQGELKRALDIFTGITAATAGQTGAEAQMNIASIYEKQGYKEEAAEAYLKVYFLYPDFDSLSQEAIYRAGLIFKTEGKNEEAEKLFMKLKEEYPESIWLKELPNR